MGRKFRAHTRIYAQGVNAHTHGPPLNKMLHRVTREARTAGHSWLGSSYISLWQRKKPIPSGADQNC
jgi:hypothetical protein